MANILPATYDSVTIESNPDGHKFNFIYNTDQKLELISPKFGADADAAWVSLKKTINGE
jgi:hypothetical protein